MDMSARSVDSRNHETRGLGGALLQWAKTVAESSFQPRAAARGGRNGVVVGEGMSANSASPRRSAEFHSNLETGLQAAKRNRDRGD